MSAAVENSAESKFELERIDESDLEESHQTESVPVLKHLDTRDSLVSNDSDISLSGDAELSEKEKNGLPEDAHMADNDTSESGSDDNTSSNEKDSGCEVTTDQACEEGEKSATGEEETPFVPPDDELANKIVAQVEFYFSDANITKDAFLLKHVRRNKEGYVSLKLISSFKRVKHLAKDWRAVAYALERSTKLEVNEARTKLRRVDPLPAFDQTTPSRTVIAINLPEKSTIESVAELFRPCGEIALIRILRPGGQIPSEVRSFANKHPEMSGVLSALIEFDRTESAKLAVERQDQDWRSAVKGMKVVELNAPPPPDRKKKLPNKKILSMKTHEQDFSSSCQSGSEAEVDPKYRQRRSSSPNAFKPEEMLQRRYSIRDSGNEFMCREQYRDRLPCSCCSHCERRYSSSGSGYDSPTPNTFRRFSISREHSDNGYQIPMVRRHSGVENPCCMSLRRCSRDSGSESSGSFPRAHEITRRFSRDSISGSENGLRRFSRESISSEGSANFRRFSRDSVGSDVFAPPFLSRNNSRDMIEINRRSSFGSGSSCPDHHVLVHSGSRSSFTVPSSCVTNCPPHMPDNVVRMPKGPDGSKGFGVTG